MGSRASSIDVFLRLHNQRKFSKELAVSGATLETAGIKGARGIASFAASSEKLKSFGADWTKRVSLPLTIGAGLAVKAAIDWEDAFTGVRKTVNATDRQFDVLESGLRGMSKEIPVAATDLAGIAEAAGQLGVERKAILGFTRVIADLGVATNLAGEEGATTLARFANIVQMPQSQFDRLGSTIVALGNAGASTESDIASMGLRIAAAGHYVGMSEAQILGYANALSSVGIEAEAGGSAISVFFKTTNSAVAEGGKKLEAFAAVAGMSSGEFKKAWETDAAAASVAWIEGLARLKKEGADVPGVLHDLSPSLRGIRIQDTLLRASGAGDLLRESLDLGSRAWKENNALAEEATKRYGTLKSRLQVLKNQAIDLGVTFGQELLPPVADVAEFLGPQLEGAAHIFGSMPPDLKAAAAGAGLFLIALGPLTSMVGYFAGGMGKTLVLMAKFQTGASSFMQIFSSAMSAGQGPRGSFGMAFQGTGAAGALQTAKGFALSLGPAVAAYGVGNILTSTLEGDYKDAGFEAGGAIAGGILGFIAGGPFGAMLGVGLGSLGGELVSGLFGDDEKKTLREEVGDRLRATKRALDAQQAASSALARAGKVVVRAHHRQRAAAQEVNSAERALAHARAVYGPNTQPVIKAEVHLAKATERVTRAKQAARKAERLKGVSRQIAKETFRSTTLELRSLKSRLQDEQFWLNKKRDALKKQGASLRQLRPVNEALVKNQDRLNTANKNLTKTAGEAAKQIGPRFAGFLRKAGDEALRLGSNTRVAAKMTRELRVQAEQLAQVRSEGGQYLSELGRNGGVPLAPETSPTLPGLDGPALPGTKRPPRSKPPSSGPPSPAGRRSLMLPGHQRTAVASGGGELREDMGGGSDTNVFLVVDGKVLAGTTVKHVKRAQNRK